MGEKVKKLKKWQKIVIVVLAIVLVVVGGFFVFRKQIGDWVLTDEEKVVLHFYNDAQGCIKRTGIDAQLYDIVYYEDKDVYNENEKKKWTKPDGTVMYEIKDSYYYILKAYYTYDDKKAYEQYNFTYFGERLNYTVDSEDKPSEMTISWITARSSIKEVQDRLSNMNWDFLKKNSNYEVNDDNQDSPNYYKYFFRSIDNHNLETDLLDFEEQFSDSQVKWSHSVETKTHKRISDDNISLFKIRLFSDYPF